MTTNDTYKQQSTGTYEQLKIVSCENLQILKWYEVYSYDIQRCCRRCIQTE
jgi:hypothetical protein